MTISKIYDIALYLAEKTDDNTGLIDQEYKSQHKAKAIELIKQAIIRFSNMEEQPLVNIAGLTFEDDVILPYFILHSVIPYYVGAILCEQDGESEKYNILIHEYQQAVSNLKYEEEQITDVNNFLEGLEG